MLVMLVTLAMLAGTLGCANVGQWSVSEARTCAPKAAPRVCVSAAPDFGHVVELAGVELLPGECAVAVGEGRGGLVRVETHDPQRARQSSWLNVPRGQATVVEIGEDGKPRRTGRLICDGTPYELGADSVSVGAAGRRE
ncbi:hypothetical protein [Enhygromyxa salina]|uniref:Lipoprotein n=1 Tax=Enhygromyxa salina TaxID=215803 RepID=A0A2S9Y3G0_9BACT|nr:hypothetical protein [Enhygromyxa salina]PRP99601.1 hypothetical protein ENSA7_62390 [Enhygromyxa salina]